MFLYITRHGQVNSRDYLESVDFPKGDPYLTPLGFEQARRTGERLKSLGFGGKIYSSPYIRTLDTAQVIAQITNSPIYPAAPIREIVKVDGAMDGFSGLTMAQCQDRCKNVVPCDFPYPWWTMHAETEEGDVVRRVGPFLDQVIEKGDDCLLVGHGASAGAAQSYVLEKYGILCLHMHPSINSYLSGFEIKGGRCRALFLRDVSHLPLEMRSANAKMSVVYQDEERKLS